MFDSSSELLRKGLDNTELMPLIEAIVDHDEAALSRLYDLTVSRVYRLAHAMTADVGDTEEIVCDVYMQVWLRAAQYDANRGSVMAWVLVNCRSLTLDLLRRRASQRTGLKNLSEQGAENGETTVAADELLDLLQEGTAVHKALSELAEIQRHLIALAYFNDMSHSEIAEAVQLPLGTVKSHIRRGLQKLRKSIEL